MPSSPSRKAILIWYRGRQLSPITRASASVRNARSLATVSICVKLGLLLLSLSPNIAQFFADIELVFESLGLLENQQILLLCRFQIAKVGILVGILPRDILGLDFLRLDAESELAALPRTSELTRNSPFCSASVRIFSAASAGCSTINSSVAVRIVLRSDSLLSASRATAEPRLARILVRFALCVVRGIPLITPFCSIGRE